VICGSAGSACAPWKRAPALPSACSRSTPPNGRLVRLRQELPAEPELEPHQTGPYYPNSVTCSRYDLHQTPRSVKKNYIPKDSCTCATVGDDRGANGHKQNLNQPDPSFQRTTYYNGTLQNTTNCKIHKSLRIVACIADLHTSKTD